MKLTEEMRNQIDLLPNCLNETQLRNCLNRIVLVIDDMATSGNCNLREVRDMARTVQKSVALKSRSMPTKHAFVCGQYCERIEWIIYNSRLLEHNNNVKNIMSKTNAQILAKYLLQDGCVVKNMAQMDTKINRNEFDEIVSEMVDVGLIIHSVHKDAEWLELSSNGYHYMRTHYSLKEGFNIW